MQLFTSWNWGAVLGRCVFPFSAPPRGQVTCKATFQDRPTAVYMSQDVRKWAGAEPNVVHSQLIAQYLMRVNWLMSQDRLQGRVFSPVKDTNPYLFAVSYGSTNEIGPGKSDSISIFSQTDELFLAGDLYSVSQYLSILLFTDGSSKHRDSYVTTYTNIIHFWDSQDKNTDDDADDGTWDGTWEVSGLSTWQLSSTSRKLFFSAFLSRSCFLYIRQKTRLPCTCAAENAICSKGVDILKARAHRFHRLPNSHIVTIVSQSVPVAVTMHDIRNTRLRKVCLSG